MNEEYQLITLLLPIAGAIATIAGAVLTVQKVRKNIQEERDAELAKTLELAKENTERQITAVEVQISSLKTEMENLRFNVNRDFEYFRQSYTSEMRAVGLKIEDLKSEISSQHTQLLNFLAKLVDKK
jgi:TolA-binding protein